MDSGGTGVSSVYITLIILRRVNMIKRIKNILEQVITKSHILFNPTLSEIKKLIRQSIRNVDSQYAQWKNDGGEDVRFFVKGNNYYVADANEYTHRDIAVELGRDVLAEDDLILGGIKEDGYVWFYKYMLLDYLKYPLGKRAWIPDDETKDMFKSTDFYKVIAPMVTDIEYK